MNIYQKIAQLKVELQNSKLKQSGFNRHAGFRYYELSDILPTLNVLLAKHKLCDRFTFDDKLATLTIYATAEEFVTYQLPYRFFDVPLTKSGAQTMQPIQYLGAVNTYYKRYLYLNAFGITDGEIIDALPDPVAVKPALPPISKENYNVAIKYIIENFPTASASKIKELKSIDEVDFKIFEERFNETKNGK